MISTQLWLTATLLVTAAKLVHSQTATNLIHQFSPPYWVENLAVRPNGNIIPVATLGTSAILQQLNPTTNTLQEIHDFSNVGNSIQGITSVAPDVFVVDILTCSTANLNCTLGSGSSWLVDLRKGWHNWHSSEESHVHELVTWPSEGLLNGMGALNDQIVLLADSIVGGIWSLDIETRVGKLLFTDQSMMPTAQIGTGINGIRVRPGKLYFTNSATATLNVISIDSMGMKLGDTTVIARNLTGPDDFEVDEDSGFAYLANGAADQVVQIGLQDGSVNAIVTLPGPTSLRWSGVEGGNLYVSTTGGLLQYVTHNITLGGAIYELNV